MWKNPYWTIVRPQQQYKNLLIFMPLIFSLKLLDPASSLAALQGFAVLCLAFGGMYIINDVIDSEKDRVHPKKSQRPIPSGKIRKSRAIAAACVLLALSASLSFALSPLFFMVVLLTVLLTTLYCVGLKNVIFLDVCLVSANFVLRCIGGAILIDSPVSPWLVVGIFLLALLLSFGKRFSEVGLLHDMATAHRGSLRHYTEGALRACLVATSAALVLAYSIYAVLGTPATGDSRLVVSIPIAAFVAVRYVSVTLGGRHREKEFHGLVLVSRGLLSAIALFVSAVMALLYLVPDHAVPDLFAL